MGADRAEDTRIPGRIVGAGDDRAEDTRIAGRIVGVGADRAEDTRIPGRIVGVGTSASSRAGPALPEGSRLFAAGWAKIRMRARDTGVERRMEDQTPQSPGCLMPIAWIIAAAVVTVIGVATVGMMASGSESAGVSAGYMASGPLGFVWGGALAALITHFVAKTPAARIGVPLGCGCLSAIGLVFGTVFFFAAIFPAL